MTPVGFSRLNILVVIGGTLLGLVIGGVLLVLMTLALPIQLWDILQDVAAARPQPELTRCKR